MLAIKLRRVGKKHQASFRVVVAEKRSKVGGNFVEDLGWVNPRTDEAEVNAERALYWMKVGAQPTDTVWNLLVRKGIIRGKKRPVHHASKQKEGAALGSAVAAAGAPAGKAPSASPAEGSAAPSAPADEPANKAAE